MSRDVTIDDREVEFYSRMADTWWDREGPFWPIHKLNELRVAYILEHVCDHFGRDPTSEQPLQGLSLVDVGCGGGILSESMARHGAEVTGVDIVEKNIAIATLHAAREGLHIDYRVATAQQLLETQETFDIVLNMEVVEHVADVAAFMRDCTRLTNSAGVMFLATINRTPLAWLFAIVGAEYILGWLPRGTHRWHMFQKPELMRQRLAEGGLEIASSCGVAANPFTRELRFTSSMAVNYMLFARRVARIDA